MPIEITITPNTKIELFDKNNTLLGFDMSDNNEHITISSNKPLIEGTLIAKISDDALLTPNSSLPSSKKANLTILKYEKDHNQTLNINQSYTHIKNSTADIVLKKVLPNTCVNHPLFGFTLLVKSKKEKHTHKLIKNSSMIKTLEEFFHVTLLFILN